jgi:hypothetical protein
MACREVRAVMRSRDCGSSCVQPFVLYKTPNGYLNGVRVCVCVCVCVYVKPPFAAAAAAARGSALAHIIWQSRNLLSLNSSSTNYENVYESMNFPARQERARHSSPLRI